MCYRVCVLMLLCVWLNVGCLCFLVAVDAVVMVFYLCAGVCARLFVCLRACV